MFEIFQIGLISATKMIIFCVIDLKSHREISVNK